MKIGWIVKSYGLPPLNINTKALVSMQYILKSAWWCYKEQVSLITLFGWVVIFLPEVDEYNNNKSDPSAHHLHFMVSQTSPRARRLIKFLVTSTPHYRPHKRYSAGPYTYHLAPRSSLLSQTKYILILTPYLCGINNLLCFSEGTFRFPASRSWSH